MLSGLAASSIIKSPLFVNDYGSLVCSKVKSSRLTKESVLDQAWAQRRQSTSGHNVVWCHDDIVLSAMNLGGYANLGEISHVKDGCAIEAYSALQCSGTNGGEGTNGEVGRRATKCSFIARPQRQELLEQL